MTRPNLADRTVYWIDRSGHSGSLTIHFEFGPDETIDLGGGEEIVQLRGHAYIESDWYSDHVQLAAFDEIQTIANLMRTTGTCILAACKNTDRELYTIVPDFPAREPMDVFY